MFLINILQEDNLLASALELVIMIRIIELHHYSAEKKVIRKYCWVIYESNYRWNKGCGPLPLINGRCNLNHAFRYRNGSGWCTCFDRRDWVENTSELGWTQACLCCGNLDFYRSTGYISRTPTSGYISDIPSFESLSSRSQDRQFIFEKLFRQFLVLKIEQEKFDKLFSELMIIEKER